VYNQFDVPVFRFHDQRLILKETVVLHQHASETLLVIKLKLIKYINHCSEFARLMFQSLTLHQSKVRDSRLCACLYSGEGSYFVESGEKWCGIL